MKENSQSPDKLDRNQTPASESIEEEKKQHHQNYEDIVNYSRSRSQAMISEAVENGEQEHNSNRQSLNAAVATSNVVDVEERAPVENHDEEIAQKLKDRKKMQEIVDLGSEHSKDQAEHLEEEIHVSEQQQTKPDDPLFENSNKNSNQGCSIQEDNQDDYQNQIQAPYEDQHQPNHQLEQNQQPSLHYSIVFNQDQDDNVQPAHEENQMQHQEDLPPQSNLSDEAIDQQFDSLNVQQQQQSNNHNNMKQSINNNEQNQISLESQGQQQSSQVIKSSIEMQSMQNQLMHESISSNLLKKQEVGNEQNVSDPDPEPMEEYESDEEEADNSQSKDAIINISSSNVLAQSAQKAVKTLSQSEGLRKSMVGKLFMGLSKQNQIASKKKGVNSASFLQKHNKKLKSNFIIRHLDSWRINWDLFIIILAIYNAIQLPMDIAFQLPIFATANWSLFDNIIDLCFTMDIIISFRTTYQNPFTGDEVYDGCDIAQNYFFGRFWIDLLSTLPFEKLVSLFPQIDSNQADNYKIVSCLKLFRILRLGRLINYLNSSDDFKMILKLMKMFFFLVLYIHIFGCMWFFLSDISGQQWTPPQYEMYLKSYDVDNEKGYNSETSFYSIEWFDKYSFSIYNAILQLCGNDISPPNIYMIWTGIFSLITGALMNANIFGTITSIFQSMNRRAQKFQEQIDMVNTNMKNMKLPEDIQTEIREFMFTTQNTLDNQKEMNQFVDMLSPSLKSLVMQHIFINAFNRNIIFSNDQVLIDYLIKDIIPYLKKPDDIIIEQDEEAFHFFFIAEGQCEVSILDHKKSLTHIPKLLNQGDYFGEVALIFDCKRTATVKSTNYCTFARIEKPIFLNTNKNFLEALRKNTFDYTDSFKKLKIKLLKQIEYFETYDLEDHTMFFDEIQYQMKQIRIEENSQFISMYQKCDKIYLIVDGQVEIEIQNLAGEICQLEILRKGDIIGMYSILNQNEFYFTANAITKVTVLALDRSFLVDPHTKVQNLKDAIYFGNELIAEHGVPIQDYKVHPFNVNQNWKFRNSKKYLLKERQKQRFMEIFSQEMYQRKVALEQKLENEKNDINQVLKSTLKQFLDGKINAPGKKSAADLFSKPTNAESNTAKPQQSHNMMQALRKNLNKQKSN